MKVFRKIVSTPEIEPGGVFASYARLPRGGRGLMEQLAAKHEMLGDLPLKLPANEPVILVTGPWIDSVAATSIGRPRAKILLYP